MEQEQLTYLKPFILKRLEGSACQRYVQDTWRKGAADALGWKGPADVELWKCTTDWVYQTDGSLDLRDMVELHTNVKLKGIFTYIQQFQNCVGRNWNHSDSTTYMTAKRLWDRGYRPDDPKNPTPEEVDWFIKQDLHKVAIFNRDGGPWSDLTYPGFYHKDTVW